MVDLPELTLRQISRDQDALLEQTRKGAVCIPTRAGPHIVLRADSEEWAAFEAWRREHRPTLDEALEGYDRDGALAALADELTDAPIGRELD